MAPFDTAGADRLFPAGAGVADIGAGDDGAGDIGTGDDGAGGVDGDVPAGELGDRVVATALAGASFVRARLDDVAVVAARCSSTVPFGGAPCVPTALFVGLVPATSFMGPAVGAVPEAARFFGAARSADAFFGAARFVVAFVVAFVVPVPLGLFAPASFAPAFFAPAALAFLALAFLALAFLALAFLALAFVVLAFVVLDRFAPALFSARAFRAVAFPCAGPAGRSSSPAVPSVRAWPVATRRRGGSGGGVPMGVASGSPITPSMTAPASGAW